MKKLVWVSLLAMLLGCYGATDDEDEGAEEEREALADAVALSEDGEASLGLVTEVAEVRELRPSLEATAELMPDPDRFAEVGPLVQGRVTSVSVGVGDRVERGQALVVLDSPDVGGARSDLLTARARKAVALATWERERDLLEGRATSTREYQDAEAELRAAEAELGAVHARLAALGAPVGEGAEVLPSARLTLRSPISGVVTNRSAHIGESVGSGDTLVEVVDLDELWLIASVYEREMRFVETGLAVQVEVRAWPGEVFEGTVGALGGALDERTRTLPVRVVLTNADHRLRPGMFATARISGTHAHEPAAMLALPWSAVQEIDGHHAVFVKTDDHTYALRRVHTGDRAGEDVEILNGIEDGDAVVTEGAFLLKGELLKATLGEDE